MGISLQQLASKLGLTESEMEKEILEMGFEIAPEFDDETAALIIDEVLGKVDKSAAEVYDELVEEEHEKEIVKSQRKHTAGKITAKKTGAKKIVKKVVTGGGAAAQKSVLTGETGTAASEEKLVPGHKNSTEIPENITVKELAEKTNLSPAVLIGALMKNGILANINQVIDYDTAVIITSDSGITLRKARAQASAEDIFKGDLSKLLAEEDKADLKKRPPVVCVMGHVDHGKTTLLDAIRNTNVVEGEAGGITQHIGAYQVVSKGRKITFLDTPGHEAFTAMRARGARATDVAILVVAADDGIMPQTVEAINHAKEAGVPIVVAINKIDKPGANLNKIKSELVEYGLQSEEWGGQTVIVPISAKKKEGINELLESVLLVADMLELKANPNRPAVATVIESHLDPNFGPVATILINTGSMKIGDNFIVGDTFGRVKLLRDHTGKHLQSMGPSDTAQLAGLHDPVESGQILQVTGNEKVARQQAGRVHEMVKEEMVKSGMGMQEILQRIKEGSLKLLKVVLKADTQGSLEAIKQALAKVKNDDVAIKIIHSGVGAISESDVMMATASRGTLVIGFNNNTSPQVKKLAEHMGIEVVTYKVIYELIDDLKKILTGMLQPSVEHFELGKFKVVKIFFTGKNEMVVGGVVTEGIMQKMANLRVMRGGVQIGDGRTAGLKLVNEDVHEIEKGGECGIKYTGKIKIEVGDIFEAWKEEKKMKTL
ncbi:MAG: translation initiation factor IF-2 [Candidatus Gracilibacteria bacterium]|jgi:translation initiation factor IF-2